MKFFIFSFVRSSVRSWVHAYVRACVLSFVRSFVRSFVWNSRLTFMPFCFASAYSDQGLAFELNSAVISASIDPKPTKKLIDDPIIIASSHLQEVEVSTCKH